MALAYIPNLIDPAELSHRPSPPCLGRVELARGLCVAPAHPRDARPIAGLLRASAPDCIPQPRASIAARLGEYEVVRDARGRVRACAAVRQLDDRRAELRGLAVGRGCRGLGLGRTLVERAVLRASLSGLQLVCVTLSPDFFSRCGFSEIPLSLVPAKPGRGARTDGRPRVAMAWVPPAPRRRAPEVRR